MPTYIIGRVTDDVIIEAFENARRKQESGEVHFQITGVRASFDTRQPDRMAFLQNAAGRGAFLISEGSLRFGTLIIRYTRGTKRAADVPGAALFDQLDFETRDGTATITDDQALEICNGLLNALPPIRPESIADAAVSDQGRVSALYSSIMERLSEAATRQTEQINGFLREKQTEFDASRKRLEEDFEKRQQAANEELRQRQSKIDERSGQLDEQQKLLDDRDNTHVRREIRRDLNNRINERMSQLTVSARSLFRELPVHAGFLGIIAIAVVVFTTQSNAVTAIILGPSSGVIRPPTSLVSAISDPLFLSALVKQTFASITAIAAAVYYVRWLIRQHSRYGQLENDLRRYQIDFERASWVVETALEWRRDQHSPFPDPLLAAVSRQLFVPETQGADVDHAPVDMLASALLGSASKVNLHAGPANIEWDGKKLSKAEMPK